MFSVIDFTEQSQIFPRNTSGGFCFSLEEPQFCSLKFE